MPAPVSVHIKQVGMQGLVKTRSPRQRRARALRTKLSSPAASSGDAFQRGSKSRFTYTHPWRVIACSACVTLLSGWGLHRAEERGERKERERRIGA